MQVRIHEPAKTKLKDWMKKQDRSGSYIVCKMINEKNDDQEIPSNGGETSRALPGNQKVRRAGSRNVARV